MNVFERHGIKHLSPSSLRLYRDEPAVWVMRYMMGLRDEGKAAMWRGKAVEAGLDIVLYGGTQEQGRAAMYAEWDRNALGDISDDTYSEFERLKGFLEQACKGVEGRPIPLVRQGDVSITVPGVEVPIIGRTDYEWSDKGLDLKTTKRMPSAAKPEHVEQMAVYMKGKKKPFALLYCSDKRHSLFEIEPEEARDALERVENSARSVRHMLGKVESASDALDLFAPDYSKFYWTPELINAAQTAQHKGAN